MVVLLIGGASSLMDVLIVRLANEGHRVYLLTGQKGYHSSYKHVFEQYNCSYSGENVKDIIGSICPDLVIHTGAFDTHYDWSAGADESVRYESDLINLLMAFSLQKRGRFVYLSSHEIYEHTHIDNIAEDEAPSVSTFRGMAIAQGEEICRSYRQNFDMDVMVLRFDHLYCFPKKGEKEDNPCFRQCLEALKTGKISASGHIRFSMIAQDEAVRYACRAMMKDAPEYDLYNISSMEEISERDLAEMVRSGFGKEVELVDTTLGERSRIVLDGRRIREEFPGERSVPYEKGVPEYVKYIKKNKIYYVGSEDTAPGKDGMLGDLKRVLWALFPFFENILIFALACWLDNRFMRVHWFNDSDFFLLYVILFAAVHGQQQAAFSAVLSTIRYVFTQMDSGAGVMGILVDYDAYIWIAQLFIVGLAIGYIRDRLRTSKAESDEKIRYLQEQLEDIENINDSNVRIKRMFESELVNQKDSLGKVYNIVSELDKRQPEEVAIYATETLSKLMETRDVAFYMVANRDYARLISALSPEARKLGTTFKYTEMAEMYEELVRQRVFFNKKLDSRYPAMALGIYENKSIRMIFMLWGVPWERMNLSEINRLKIFGLLIQDKILLSERYLERTSSLCYFRDTNLLNPTEFTMLLKAFRTAGRQAMVECLVFQIDLGNQAEERDKAYEALRDSFYKTDHIGVLEDGQMYLLAANVGEEYADLIVDKIHRCGYSCVRKDLGELC